MLSFYFGREGSFVWAVPKDGPVTFAAVKVPARRDREQGAQAARGAGAECGDDRRHSGLRLALGYELYSLLLKPVEAGWKSAKSLIVVTNGALGLLPLSLLPTAPAEIKASDEPLFASYRNVPWLARTHAVTMVPSSARCEPCGNCRRASRSAVS